MRMLGLFLCSLLLAPAAAAGQAAGAAHHAWSSLDSITGSGHDGSSRAVVGRVIEDRGHYSMIVLRRNAPGQPELHAEWDDVMVIQEGRARVSLGGRMNEGEEVAPGEFRGGQLVDFESREAGPGDVLVIPAGVPHAVAPIGSHVRYLLLKVMNPGGESAD